MIVVSDTSVLTNLAAIGYLHLLPTLYQRVLLPNAVYEELTKTPQPVPGGQEIQEAEWVEVRGVKNKERVQALE